MIHGKLRTPKNITFNKLIEFFNDKYLLSISESLLDAQATDFNNNSWLTGFTEADGHFGIKYIESKGKSDTRKRSVSENISLRFRLDQRLLDKPSCFAGCMKPFMERLSLYLDTNLKCYNSNKTRSEVLSLYISSIDKISFLINYFDKYPLLGEKYDSYVKWVSVYNMIISKQHLTDEGRLKIRELIGKLD